MKSKPLFKYFIVGIRPHAYEIREILVEGYNKDCVIISFDGARNIVTKDQYDDEKSKLLMRRPLSRGEVGCAIGHWLAYQNAGNSDWIIVLEDDIEIQSDPTVLEAKLQKLSNSPKVVHLDDIDLPKTNAKYGKYSWHHRPYRTHAYALNKSAIKIILRYQKSIQTTADWPIQWEYAFPFFWVSDDTFSLAEAQSLIENERRPLQFIQHQDFQLFRSKIFLFKKIEKFNLGRCLVGFFYIVQRFVVYVVSIQAPLVTRIRSAAARAYSDIR